MDANNAKRKSRIPDFNPDKDKHIGGYNYVVHPRAGSSTTEFNLGAKTVKLNQDGRAIIKDEGLARELQTEHRFDAVVSRIPATTIADRGHTYFFGSMPEMPWKREKKDAKEIEDQPEDKQAGEGRGLRPGSGSGNCPEHGPQETETPPA